MLKHWHRRKARRRAIVFIDYESWFYSYKRLFHFRPDPRSFRAELEKEYDLEDIMIFGDFSPAEMAAELPGLRGITNTIIETGNTFNRRKKDMTDFIMLDYIYQYADGHGKIDTYILLTGDGHFQSVVKYLTQKKKKEVLLYAVRGALSRQLREAATQVQELPREEELKRRYYGMILQYLEYAEHHAGIIPTFAETGETVAKQNQVNRGIVEQSLAELVHQGYITKRSLRVKEGHSVKILTPEWERLRRDGWWDGRS